MKVLVTGATGFVGRALVAGLAPGMQVLAAVRQGAGPGQVAVGDIDGHTRWDAALKGCDAVVHAAARVHQMQETGMQGAQAFARVNTEGSINLARQAAAQGVKRFIFISSVKAMGEGGSFRASDACHPQEAYGKSKRDAELQLQELAANSGMEVVILRLPLVYGPGVGANFLRLMQIVDRGLPLPFGLVDNRRSLIGLDNLVDLVATCLVHPAAANQIFLVSDGHDVSTPELIRHIATALRRPARLLPVPVGLMRIGASLLGKRAPADRLFGSLAVDSSPLRLELGWKAPLKLQQGLQETARWYLQGKAAS